MVANQFNRGIGIGFTLLFESQIFPFMLSFAFTCRTIVQEKGQQKEVNEDVLIAVGFSIAFSVLMSYFFKDYVIALIGTIVGIALALTYELRGELI